MTDAHAGLHRQAIRISCAWRPSRTERTRVQAHRHRLRLLDLPPQRHRDVLGLLRDLRRAARADRGRPERARAVRPAQRRDRNRLPAGVELHLRPRHASRPTSAAQLWFQIAMAVTCVLRPRLSRRSKVREFASLVARGAGPTRSAFLSAFFTLVGCHGMHVSAGILWLLTMMAQVFAKGFRADIHAPPPVLCAVLARARHHLGRRLHRRLSARERGMSDQSRICIDHARSRARRRARKSAASAQRLLGYLIGLGLAILLTATSFFVAGTDLVWQPSIPVALVVLAIAQMGVHLVFFLHITTGARQHQQRAGARLRRPDRVPGDRRIALDHGEPQPQHDADGSDHADAALAHFC